MREGLTCVLSREGARAQVQQPDQGQAGVVSEVRGPVEDIVSKLLADYLQERPNDAKIIVRQDHRGRTRTRRPLARRAT